MQPRRAALELLQVTSQVTSRDGEIDPALSAAAVAWQTRTVGSADRTQTDVRTGPHAGLEERTLPVLIVAFHDDPAWLGRRVELIDGDELVLGRGSEAFGSPGLMDHRVSRRHASIRREGTRVALTDLGSHNGTFVNGLQVQRCELAPHDVIEIGRVLLLFAHRPLLPRSGTARHLVGVSSAHGKLLELVERYAAGDAPVLIRGETGVGKELVAAELHERSSRPGRLVCVNCAALSDGVVHSELFGHVRGAFSGATEDRGGMLGEAQNGTLFLDEIGDASVVLQASLLRLLEQGEYRPVGSDRARKSNARILAATHIELEEAVEAAAFRRDLFARLERCVLRVPPLRERPEDVMALAHHFARRARGRPVVFRRSTALALVRAPWPRNVRQLRAVVERSARASEGAEALTLGADELEQLFSEPIAGAAEASHDAASGKPTAEHLVMLLTQHAANVSEVARVLGVSRNTVYRWLSSMDIDLQTLRERTQD